MMQRYFLLFIVMCAFGCGEDEQPQPTFEELIEGYGVVWDPDDPSLDRSISEMEPVTCTMASGTYARCYGLGVSCGDGKLPTICFDDKAVLVACKRGAMSTAAPTDDIAFSSRSIRGLTVFFDEPPEGVEIITCED